MPSHAHSPRILSQPLALPPASAPDAGPRALSPADDATILKLWGETRDTLAIARRLNRPEAQIANRLAQLRDDDGTPMTQTQYALHHARKARLARLRAAAARVAANAPTPVAAAALPPTVAIDRKAAQSRAAGVKPLWFRIEGESEAPFMPAMPSARAIQNAVCAFYGVALRDMLSPRRHAAIVRPRQVAVYLCRELTMLSMPKIGRLFGGRDHTTILASNRKIATLLKTDDELALAIATLRERLSSHGLNVES